MSSSTEWLEGFLGDVSRCSTLESLRIVYDGALEPPYDVPESMQLPDMHLLGMPSLMRVRLDNCLPGHELALPADCSLFLDALAIDGSTWKLQWEKLQHHTRVLQLDYFGNMQWPEGILSFSNLQYLGLDMEAIWSIDVAELQHIPHVRITTDATRCLHLAGGSWQTFEVFHFGRLRIVITDVESFVRNTRDFTFMSEVHHDTSHAVMKSVSDACLRQGKACHFNMFVHYAIRGGRPRRSAARGERVMYTILSTSRQATEDFPVMGDDTKRPQLNFGSSMPLADREDFWPSDPCDSVKRACA